MSSLHTKLIAKLDLIAKLHRAGTKQIPFNFIRSLHFFHPIVSVASSISLLFYSRPTIVVLYCTFKFITEKYRGGRFLWNRNWDLGWFALLKKKTFGLIMSTTFESGYFKFLWAKKKNINCSIRTRKLHKLKLKKIFFFLNN